ncbi:hypothetical protein [Priestia flexa]|uniref:hypothetical protein n=1 Tax=Priestia flexa TaxID=86664 RepID=UPI003D2F213F
MLDVTKRSWDGVAGGATDADVDTWNDLVHMVQHPVETAESIGEGVKAVWDDPKGVAKTIGNEIKDSWNEQVINGDAKSRGHYFSYLTANVAMSIVGTKGADKLAKTTKLEQISGAATKKLNEGAAAIHVRTQSALQNLGLNKLDNRLAYPGVESVKGNGGYQFIERVDGGNGVGTKVRDEKVAEDTGKSNYDELKVQLKERYKKFVDDKRQNIPQISVELLPNELNHGKFGKLPNEKGDNITGHHMPSNKYMQEEFEIKTKDSYAMFLEHPHPGQGGRHRRTFTYGLSKRTRAEDFDLYMSLKPRDSLVFDINDLRRIIKEDGLYNNENREKLKEYIDYYKRYEHNDVKIFGKPK